MSKHEVTSCLAHGHTTLKRSVTHGFHIVYTHWLLLSADGLTYRVLAQYREPNGTTGSGYLYEGPNLKAANYVYNRYSGDIS